MTLLAFILCFVGFVLLSLSMGKHLRQVWPQRVLSKVQVWGLRVVGYVCLAAALLPAIAAEGVAVGIVLWFALLTGAALPQALLLTYRPNWVPPATLLAAVIGASALAFATV